MLLLHYQNRRSTNWFLQGYLKASISVLGPHDEPVEAPYHVSNDVDIEASVTHNYYSLAGCIYSIYRASIMDGTGLQITHTSLRWQ